MFDLCCLCCFVVVVEILYFGCVVQCLYMVQLFLIWQIFVLEEELGFCLFDCFSWVVIFIVEGSLFLFYVCVLLD